VTSVAVLRFIDSCHRRLLSSAVKDRVDNWTLTIAIIAFAVHLLIIFAVDFGLVDWFGEGQLLTDPIAAVYTPFSFILVYEVYLLVYYLPNSVTVYIGKQYEIITLVIIRRIFASSAESVGLIWLRKLSELVIQGHFIALSGFETVRLSQS